MGWRPKVAGARSAVIHPTRWKAVGAHERHAEVKGEAPVVGVAQRVHWELIRAVLLLTWSPMPVTGSA